MLRSWTGLLHRAGNALALGAAPRGQPLRRAALRRAVRARPPRGGGRAVRLARAGPRGARDGQGDALDDPDALLGGAGLRLACSPSGSALPFRRGGSVSLPLDVSRTLEELLERAELDFVHVHEPFAPSAASAALRHSRALNVGTFHSATERFLSTQVARRVVELLFGRLDGRTASFAATRDLVARYFPGDYAVIHPGADLHERPAPKRRRARPRSCSRPRRSAARCGSSCARCGGCRCDLDWRATIWLRDPATAPAPDAVRGGCASASTLAGPARRLGGPVPRRAPRSRWPPRPARRPRRSSCCARWRAARCRWSRGCRSTRRSLRDGELGLLFEPRDALTLAAQLERLLARPGAA